MGTIRAEEHRHGMPLEPWRSALHIVETLADLPFLMSRRGAECNPVGDLFRRHLETGVSTEDEAWLDFLVHDHYMWHSARLRTAHATVELRSACQQPPDEHMAACALGFAMVCAGAELSAYLDEALGEGAWAALSRYRDAVVREGLAARGRGEEVYLGPLYRRLEAQENPAQRVLKIFAQSGPTALVEALSWKR